MLKIKKNVKILAILPFFLFSCVNIFGEQKQENEIIINEDELQEHCPNPEDHELAHFNEIAPSIDADGIKEHYRCIKCGSYFNIEKIEVDKETLITKLPIFNYKNSTESVSLLNGPTEDNFDDAKHTQILDFASNLQTKIENLTTSNQEIIDGYYLLADYRYELSYEETKAMIRAQHNPTAENYARESTIHNASTGAYYAQVNIYIACGKSPYKSALFSGLTNYQINQIILSYEKTVSSESIESERAMNDAHTDYKSGKMDADVAYSKYVKAANDYAQIYGSKDYINYVYKNVYWREYGVDINDTIEPYITTYISPLHTRINSRISDYYDSMNDKDEYRKGYEEAEHFNKYFFGYYFDQMYDYSKFVGGDYLSNFKNFFENGRYYLSNNYNPNITGYISSFPDGTLFMFLGRDYQQTSTFIHEFGHYNAGLTYSGYSNYDLAELQSQGNEMLFYSYLCQENKLNERACDLIILNQISSMLSTVLLGYAINEVEIYAYTSENFTKNDIENKWAEVGNTLGFDFTTDSAKSYLWTVLLNYDCYYISYAISAIASLELYAKSLIDLDAAKESYKSIYTSETNNEMFFGSLENANLPSVLKEEAYQLISNIAN